MSTKTGVMYHPGNRSTVDIYSGFSWPVLFFGCFWYGFKGMWGWAALALAAAMCTWGLSWFVFPFLANGQHVDYLKKQGYLTKAQLDEGKQPQQAAAAAPAPRDVAAELEKFHDLRQKGILSQEEFDLQKKRLLQSA